MRFKSNAAWARRLNPNNRDFDAVARSNGKLRIVRCTVASFAPDRNFRTPTGTLVSRARRIRQ